MLKQKLLALALVITSGASAEVRTLPAPQSNYHTFNQPVTEAPKIAKPTQELKQLADDYKTELNAKKVDIITLANGDTCLLAFNKQGELALRSTHVKKLGGNFISPWSKKISLIKIKGDEKNFYYESTANKSESNPEIVPFVRTKNGSPISNGHTALHAFEIDGKVYLHALNPIKNTPYYSIKDANPAPGTYQSYQSSISPYYYVSASEATTATDTVNGVPISLPTLPHMAYFGSNGGRVYLDGSNGANPIFATKSLEFKNSGYLISITGQPEITASTTTGIVDGVEKKGTLISLNPPTSDKFLSLSLYGPDGKRLLTNCRAMDFSEPDQMVYYKMRQGDNSILMGAISLADTSLLVPAKFANVQRAINAEGNGVWLVARKAFAPLEVYDPDADYTPEYRNIIEEKYNNRFYSSVLSQVKYEKDSLSYEDLLLVLSAYTIEIKDKMPKIEKMVAQYRTGVEPEGMDDQKSSNNISLLLFKHEYPMPGLDGYCKRVVELAPDEDKELATRIAAEAQNTYGKAHRLITEDFENARRGYDSMYAQRRQDKAKADALAAQQAQEVALREARLREERQQAIALAFIKGIGAVLQATLSGPSQSSGRRAAVSSGGTTTSVPSSYSSGGSGKVDNSSRKAFLKSQIIEWKNKAKKAEASYQQALSGGDDTWQKKRVIDSKRRSVDEALEMVRQYEAELNSLK